MEAVLLWLHVLVVEADGAGDLPGAVFVVPEGDELRFADAFFGMAGVVEAVNADLDGAVVLQWIDLERTGYERSLRLAADVAFDCVEERLFADGEACLVVVELEVVVDHRVQCGEVAGVVGVEELSIKRADGGEER